MEKKEIKPAKAFWSAFIGGIVFAFIMIFIMGGGKMLGDPTGLALVFEMCLGCGIAFGCIFGLMSWIAKRNQKINEKDDLNDLMRQYLEKKLREEENEKN